MTKDVLNKANLLQDQINNAQKEADFIQKFYNENKPHSKELSQILEISLLNTNFKRDSLYNEFKKL